MLKIKFSKTYGIFVLIWSS